MPGSSTAWNPRKVSVFWQMDSKICCEKLGKPCQVSWVKGFWDLEGLTNWVAQGGGVTATKGIKQRPSQLNIYVNAFGLI